MNRSNFRAQRRLLHNPIVLFPTYSRPLLLKVWSFSFIFQLYCWRKHDPSLPPSRLVPFSRCSCFYFCKKEKSMWYLADREGSARSPPPPHPPPRALMLGLVLAFFVSHFACACIYVSIIGNMFLLRGTPSLPLC